MGAALVCGTGPRRVKQKCCALRARLGGKSKYSGLGREALGSSGGIGTQGIGALGGWKKLVYRIQSLTCTADRHSR